MGLFDSFFNRRDRELRELMNPLLAMTLKEFVVANDDTGHLKHYFRFRNKESSDEEFIVNYRGFNSPLEYLGTHWKRLSVDREFRMLSDDGPWSMAITYLIEHGRQLAANTRPTRGHFSSRVSVKNPRTPNNWAQPLGDPVRSTEYPLMSVRMTDWIVHHIDTGSDGTVQNAEISRIFHIAGMQGSVSTINLRIVCSLGRGTENQTELHRGLQFIFWTLELPRETSLVMHLGSIDQSHSVTCDVVAAPLEADPGIAVISKYGDEDYVKHCLNEIMSGKDLSFMLADQKQTLIKCFLPNDKKFKQLYDETCSRLAETQPAELAKSSPTSKIIIDCAELIRGNLKDHAIWMYEQAPGEFGVLLVKLDREGKMADAWSLGNFASRSEQGAFALEVARELQIQLMDVVPN
jgi:hypothetical protein